jgi:leucyl-tRNA synthetase
VATWVASTAGGQSDADEAVARVHRARHRTIHRVTEDIEDHYHFNTAVAALMEYVNALSEVRPGGSPVLRAAMIEALHTLAVLLGPFAPHLAEQLWAELGRHPSVSQQPWPTPDPAWLTDSHVTVPVQINGKLRGTIVVEAAAAKDVVIAAALTDPKISAWVGARTPIKIIYVPGRLVNLVLP